MSWTSGYRRLADRSVMPHPAMRELSVFLLQGVTRTMRRSVEDELRETGLSWVDAAMLIVLSRVDGLSQSALVARTGVDRTRASGHLGDLEEEGLVARSASEVDRRRLVVHLTEGGRLAAAEALEAIARAEGRVLRRLQAEERRQLAALLGRVLPDDTPWLARMADG